MPINKFHFQAIEISAHKIYIDYKRCEAISQIKKNHTHTHPAQRSISNSVNTCEKKKLLKRDLYKFQFKKKIEN